MSEEIMKIDEGICYFKIIIEKNKKLNNYSHCDKCSSPLEDYVYLVPSLFKYICKNCLDEIIDIRKKSKVS